MKAFQSFKENCSVIWRVYVPRKVTKRYLITALYGMLIGSVVCGVLGIATVPDSTPGIIASFFVGALLGFPLFLGFAMNQTHSSKKSGKKSE